MTLAVIFTVVALVLVCFVAQSCRDLVQDLSQIIEKGGSDSPEGVVTNEPGDEVDPEGYPPLPQPEPSPVPVPVPPPIGDVPTSPSGTEHLPSLWRRC